MPNGDGFRVDVEKLRGASNRVGDGRSYVGAALCVVNGLTLPPEPFGATAPGARMAADLEAIVNRRVTGLNARLRRMQEIMDNLNASADEYERVESDSSTRLNGIATSTGLA